MRERSRSPRAPRRRQRVGLVTIVLLIVGGWFVLLSILGHRLQQGRLQRLGAEVDAAAEAAAEIAAEAAAEIDAARSRRSVPPTPTFLSSP